MSFVKAGQPVEFTNDNPSDYTLGSETARYGIAVADATSHCSVRVMLADRSIVTARNIQAYGWAGWLPEELEDIYAELNPEAYGDNEEDF